MSTEQVFQSHWTQEQIEHLARLEREGAKIAYWNSDQFGGPANGGDARQRVRPGLVQVLPGPLKSVCGYGAFHATLEPHRWAGCRVWIVGLVGPTHATKDKVWGLHREVIGEILPEEALADSVGVRLGRRDLQYADLQHANFQGADLRGATLQHANFQGADLRGATLQHADLQCANFQGADLRGADLQCANFQGADLRGADLQGADLRDADLRDADLGDWERGPDGYAKKKS